MSQQQPPAPLTLTAKTQRKAKNFYRRGHREHRGFLSFLQLFSSASGKKAFAAKNAKTQRKAKNFYHRGHREHRGFLSFLQLFSSASGKKAFAAKNAKDAKNNKSIVMLLPNCRPG